jgi:hypothetical protein
MANRLARSALACSTKPGKPVEIGDGGVLVIWEASPERGAVVSGRGTFDGGGVGGKVDELPGVTILSVELQLAMRNNRQSIKPNLILCITNG